LRWIGKVLLAHLPGPEQSRYLAAGPFVALTDRTITDPARLKAELGRIAGQGFAIDNEEVVTGLQCLAVPVRTGRGEVVAAISTSRAARGDLDRWQQRVVPRLQAGADQIGSMID
jgi:IclR family acetate operon transcriptional repressor